MKAITYDRYGPPEVLQIEEREKPVPQANEILIRTHATTVTSGDWRARSLSLPKGFGVLGRLIFGINRPRQELLGSELAGVVDAVGDDVTRFTPGQRVFVFTGANLGCYAEYKCMPEDGNVVPMPEGFSFAEAAAMSFGGTTALDFFRKGKLTKGERVLINGASGGVGTTAVQIAKHFGADVTGVCSEKNVELVMSLGADRVINYQTDDFVDGKTKYDIIMDTVGTAPYARSKRALTQNGRLLMVMGELGDLLRSPIVSLASQHRIVGGAAAERLDDLQHLAQLATQGVFKPVIDRTFRVDDIVEAHHYVDSGRKRGSVVILWN